MRQILLIIIATAILGYEGYAQQQTSVKQSETSFKTFKISKSLSKIHIDLADAIIEGYPGKEIIFSSLTEPAKEDEQAKGLTSINGLGLTDNTGLGLNVSEINGVLQVSQMNSIYPAKIKIEVPEGINVVFEHLSKFGKAVVFRNIKGEIDISTSESNITLENVTGPAVIKSVHGDVKAQFSPHLKGPISVVSINGYVDVTLPANIQANLKMSTKYGALFISPELKIDVQQHDNMTSYNNQVNAKISGGGLSIDLRSETGKIYLRAK